MHKCYKTPHIYFLDSDRTANVYFTSDVDAKNRIRSLNEFSKINLNANRRAGMHDEEILKTVSLVIKSLMIKLHLLIIVVICTILSYNIM